MRTAKIGLSPQMSNGELINRIRELSVLSDSGCWLWTAGIGSRGYAQAHFGGKSMRVSRLILGLTDPNMYACHTCDTPRCVNPNHLFVGTNQDNMNDMKRKGRRTVLRGENAPGAKLKTADIIKIKKMAMPQRQIAKLYGVSQTIISKIKLGKRWSHTNNNTAAGEIC